VSSKSATREPILANLAELGSLFEHPPQSTFETLSQRNSRFGLSQNDQTHKMTSQELKNTSATSHLIFPVLSSNLSTTLSALKRSALSIPNRLNSIVSDSEFVISISEAYGLPLVANERCGSWYIPPDQKSGSAYFKSTDGHAGQWAFSVRRLNLDLLDIVAENHGYVNKGIEACCLEKCAEM
jgi:hypothetical protein